MGVFVDKQKTAYDVSECDCRSDVCSYDLWVISFVNTNSFYLYDLTCLAKFLTPLNEHTSFVHFMLNSSSDELSFLD